MRTKKKVSEYISRLLILKIQNIQILFFFFFKVIVSSDTQPVVAEFHDEVSLFPVSFASILWAGGHASLASGGHDSVLHTLQSRNLQQPAAGKVAVSVRRWLRLLPVPLPRGQALPLLLEERRSGRETSLCLQGVRSADHFTSEST